MDDFATGPDSFYVTLNSLDSQATVDSKNASFKSQLSKPLEFTAGTWEVCLRRLIFRPESKSGTFFKVLTDFTVPEVFGSKLIPLVALAVLPSSKEDKDAIYTFDSCNYSTVGKSFISSIEIKIEDIKGAPIQLAAEKSLVVAQLHFRRKLVIPL